MDILYIVGTGSRWGNNELRYSLRSIEKNGINVGRVFLCGNKPDFVSDAVTHIPCDDLYPNKHKNILMKIKKAITNSKIGEHFLVSSDDIYTIAPTDFDNYPFYCKDYEKRKCRTMLPTTNEESKSLYTEELIATRKFLERHDLPCYNFSGHNLHHYSRDMFSKLGRLYHEAQNTTYGVEPNILIANYWYKHDPFEITIRKDKKINKDMSLQDFEESIHNFTQFSIGDFGIKVASEFFKKEFPNKSKYEK